MFNNLPISLLKASERVADVLKSCVSCGAVIGGCPHTDGLREDVLSSEITPDEETPEDELSGEKEEVVINPPYQTSLYKPSM